MNRKRVALDHWRVFSDSGNVCFSLFSGEANAIVAKATARAEGIEKVSLALQQQVCRFFFFITCPQMYLDRWIFLLKVVQKLESKFNTNKH